MKRVIAVILALMIVLLISACNAPPEEIFEEISSRQYNVEMEYIPVAALAKQDIVALRDEINALDVNLELLDFSSELPKIEVLDIVSLSAGGTLTRSEWESLFYDVAEEYFGATLTDNDITYFINDGSANGEYPVTHNSIDPRYSWMQCGKKNAGAVFQPVSYWFRLHRGDTITALDLSADAWWTPNGLTRQQAFDIYRGEGMDTFVATSDGQIDVIRAGEIARTELEKVGAHCVDPSFSYAPYRAYSIPINEDVYGIYLDMRVTYKGVNVDFSYTNYNYVSDSEYVVSPFSGTCCEAFLANNKATDYLLTSDMLGARKINNIDTLSNVVSLRSAASIVSCALAAEKEFAVSSIEFVYLFEYAQEDIGTREAETELRPFWKFNISNNNPKLSIFVDASNGEAHILRAFN